MLTVVDIHVRPLVLSQADHAALSTTETGTNKHWNLDGVRVLYSSLSKSVLRNPIYSRRTDDIGFNVSYFDI